MKLKTADNINRLFLELVRISIGNGTCLSSTPSPKDWYSLYQIAEKQSLVGLCFAGVQKLHSQEQIPPMDLLMEWLGQAEYIKTTNHHVDEQCVQVLNLLSNSNLDACILKGQGVGCLYENLSDLRQSGDIDVWVKGGFNVVNDFVQKTKPTTDIAYHRFHYNIFEDTEVELHHRPTLMRNLFDDSKLQKWCDSFDSTSFKKLENGFIVPPLAFNRIFILTHIYRHFLFEGIGLRQIVDFYYVLKAENLTNSEKQSIGDLLTSFRLQRFASGIMWILCEVLGLNENYLICNQNEEEGRFILEEILNTGNFGQGDSRYKNNGKLRRMSRHGAHLILHYPSEVLWTPIWLVYHFFWKKMKIREIKNMLAKKETHG